MATTGKVRIISGQWRRRQLRVPAVADLRPTPDRVRETLFNWLTRAIPGARCLDLYAGSGALGFEAASRGAARVVLVERDPHVVACLREEAAALGADQIQVVQADARRWLQGEATPFDIVFLDPPYGENDLGGLCAALAGGGWLAPDALVYLESRRPLEPADLPDGFRILRRQKAGQVRYHLAAAGNADIEQR